MKKKVYSIEEYKTFFGKPKRKGKKRGEMNKLERAFADKLEIRRLAGEIKEWLYCESKDKSKEIRFYIGSIIVIKNGRERKYDLYYTPDFRAINNDGSKEHYETKGHEWQAAYLRFRVAVALYPNETFFKVQRLRNRWVYTQYKGV